VLARLAEIGEFADLVHLHPLRTPAYLATVQQESGDQFLMTDRLGDQRALCKGLYAVGEDRVLLPPKRNTTVPRDQWLVTLAALHTDLEASARPVGSLDSRYLRAIFDTDEPYLPASVLSIEVTITQFSRLSRATSPANR